MTQHTVETIRELLATSDAAVERAILAIAERQTADERLALATNYANSVGFNKFDAPFLTSMADWLRRKTHLTPKQMAASRKKIMKYSGQLLDIAKLKAMAAAPVRQYGNAKFEYVDGAYIAEASALGFKPGEKPHFAELKLVNTIMSGDDIHSWVFETELSTVYEVFND